MKKIYSIGFKSNFISSFNSINDIGLLFFQLGILLLASAPTISIFLLIIASIMGSLIRFDQFFKDSFNWPFIFSSLFMVLNALFLTINKEVIYSESGIYSKIAIFSQETSLLWIGLLNWIPFFWCFWSFQKYLSNNKLRIKCAKLFVFGTLPVLISGFFQYFLGIYGPFRFFNNLIVWYQRPLSEDNGVTGIFNNQNYAGAWLCILLPLCIGFLIKEKENKFIKLSIFSLFISFVFMTILTTSRSAIFSAFISIICLFKLKRIRWIVVLFIITIFLIKLFPDLTNQIINLNNLLPGEINKMFSMNLSIDNFPRLEVWSKTITFIKTNPFFGYGAGSFPLIYSISSGEYWGMQHTHNIILQIAFNFGIINSFLISITMLLLLIFSGKYFFFLGKDYDKNLKNKLNIIDKSWIFSYLIFFLIHMFDLTYFDGRISILSWVLLSGMRSIIKEKNNQKLIINK